MSLFIQVRPGWVGSGKLDRWTTLVEFHQHATGPDVPDPINALHPNTIGVFGEVADAAFTEPPTCGLVFRAAVRGQVVINVRSAELAAVRRDEHRASICHRITGVSAVPGHRQFVIIILITDGERRVFSPVPLTAKTLDLYTHSKHTRYYNNLVSIIN